MGVGTRRPGDVRTSLLPLRLEDDRGARGRGVVRVCVSTPLARDCRRAILSILRFEENKMTDPNENPGDPKTPDSSLPSAPGDPSLTGKDEVTSKTITDTLHEDNDEVSLSAAKTIGEASEQVAIRLGIEEFIEQQW